MVSKNPKDGWGKQGLYRLAHDRALQSSYRDCITARDEQMQYEMHFRRELNKIISRGEKHESTYQSNKNKRNLEKQTRAKSVLQAALDAEVMELKEKMYR